MRGAIYAAGVFGMKAEEPLEFSIAINVTGGAGVPRCGLVDDRLGSKLLISLLVLGAELLVV